MPTSPRSPIRRQHRWSGLSAEERQAQRRTLLLDAAFDLLGTEGWDATTVRAIVERAELNARYFYESFEDIDELIVAVYDRVVGEMATEVLAAVETTGADPTTQAREVVRRIVEFVDEDRRRGRVLYVEGLGNEALNRRRLDAGQGVVAFFERAAGGSFGHVERVAAAIVVGGFSQLLIDWLSGRIKVTRDQLVDDATALFLALGDATARVASSH